MKLVVSSDYHIDFHTAGVRREEDIADASLLVVERAIEIEADLFLFLGDLCDPDVGAFMANHIAIRRHAQLAEAGVRDVWLVGNHDQIETSRGDHAMLPLAAVATVVAEPEAFLIGPRLWLLCFPYTSTARTYDPIVEAQKMRALVPPGDRVVVASHLMLEGITPGSETTDMARGRDVFLPVARLVEMFGSPLILNGHFHTSQTYQHPMPDLSTYPVYIPGSLVRLTKGEIGNVPGYLIVEVP